jgi:cytosine/adenosine deaminase-related metal-dependent hydrolase
MRRLLAFALLASLPVLPAQTPADLVITHGNVVTMNDRREVIEGGVVVIRGAKLLAIGPAPLAAQFTAKRTIDARGGIVMPGMINTHTHAAMTIFRSLGDDVADRLKRFMFPLEAKFVDREVVHWGTLHGLLEMVEGGVTTFVDMYYFEDEVARVAKQVGMRGVLGETVINQPAPDATEPYGGFELARKFIADFRGDPLITPAFAPHAPYTLDEAHLRAIAQASAALDAPVLMHIEEMPDEMATFRKERNQTPIEFSIPSACSTGASSPRTASSPTRPISPC